MNEAALTKVTVKTARELSPRVPLSEPAKALLQEKQTPEQYLKVLADQGHLPDAIQLLAYALPKREGVGWAWQCAREGYGPKPEPKFAAALEAARRWVAEPTEEWRGQRDAAAGGAGTGNDPPLTPGAGCWGGASEF